MFLCHHDRGLCCISNYVGMLPDAMVLAIHSCATSCTQSAGNKLPAPPQITHAYAFQLLSAILSSVSAGLWDCCALPCTHGPSVGTIRRDCKKNLLQIVTKLDALVSGALPAMIFHCGICGFIDDWKPTFTVRRVIDRHMMVLGILWPDSLTRAMGHPSFYLAPRSKRMWLPICCSSLIDFDEILTRANNCIQSALLAAWTESISLSLCLPN